MAVQNSNSQLGKHIPDNLKFDLGELVAIFVASVSAS